MIEIVDVIPLVLLGIGVGSFVVLVLLLWWKVRSDWRGW